MTKKAVAKRYKTTHQVAGWGNRTATGFWAAGLRDKPAGFGRIPSRVRVWHRLTLPAERTRGPWCDGLFGALNDGRALDLYRGGPVRLISRAGLT